MLVRHKNLITNNKSSSTKTRKLKRAKSFIKNNKFINSGPTASQDNLRSDFMFRHIGRKNMRQYITPYRPKWGQNIDRFTKFGIFNRRYIKARYFWGEKKVSHQSRRRRLWQSKWRPLKKVPGPLYSKLKRRYSSKKLARFVKVWKHTGRDVWSEIRGNIIMTNRIHKWLRTKARALPQLWTFRKYYTYLSIFFSYLHRRQITWARNSSYWKAGWFVSGFLDWFNKQKGTPGQQNVRGLTRHWRFSFLPIWVERWWWSKFRIFKLRPRKSLLQSAYVVKYKFNNLSKSILFNNPLNTAGFIISESRHNKRPVIKSFGISDDESAERNSSVFAKFSESARQTWSDKNWQPNWFSAAHYSVKDQSFDYLQSLNFLHPVKWVSFFINAFVKHGKKEFIENRFKQAQLYMRSISNIIADPARGISTVLTDGKPIFRFVVFERKMKKRKRKTWTVPKMLWKDRGFVWGARVLWLQFTSGLKEFKLINRLVSVLGQALAPDLLSLFVSDKFYQTRRANRLSRWMRFLRGRFKRKKLRSIIRFDEWWKYGWNNTFKFKVMQRIPWS